LVGVSDANDHNDVWQDGGVIVDFGETVVAYFTSFIQQFVPTDNLRNTDGSGHEIDIPDEGSLLTLMNAASDIGNGTATDNPANRQSG
jgi:hypothetical protein